jgi:hypothetical protein
MRLIYTSLPFFFTVNLFAQDSSLLKRSPDQVEVTEVVQLASFPASQLYFNSTLFLDEAFQGVRETSQMKDKKTKSVATKGSFPVFITNGYGEEIEAKVVFTLIIQCQENKYRYALNDLYFAYTEATGITSYASFNNRRGLSMSPKQWQEVEAQTETFVRQFTADLKERMAQQEVLCKEVLSMNKKKSRQR